MNKKLLGIYFNNKFIIQVNYHTYHLGYLQIIRKEWLFHSSKIIRCSRCPRFNVKILLWFKMWLCQIGLIFLSSIFISENSVRPHFNVQLLWIGYNSYKLCIWSSIWNHMIYFVSYYSIIHNINWSDSSYLYIQLRKSQIPRNWSISQVNFYSIEIKKSNIYILSFI